MFWTKTQTHYLPPRKTQRRFGNITDLQPASSQFALTALLCPYKEHVGIFPPWFDCFSLIWQYCNHNLTCEASLLSKSWLWNAFPHRSKTFKTRIETEIKLWTHPGVIFSYSCVKAADQSVPVWSPFFFFFFFISSTVYKGKKSAQTSCWEVNNLRVLYWWCHSFHAPVSWLNSSEGVAMNSLL